MTVLTEVTNIYTAINSYFSDLAESISSGSMPPDISTLLDALDNAELITYCSNLSEHSAGFQVGVAQESAITAFAITREANMCSLNKTQIYDNCEADNLDQAQFYDEMGAFNLGVLKGAPTSGAKS